MMHVSADAWVFGDECRRWIAEQRIVGVDGAALVELLVADGADEEDAWRAVALVDADPIQAAALAVVERLRRLEAVLDVQGALGALSPAASRIPRRHELGGPQFLAQHYAPGRPVILTDVADRWPARRRWTAEYLKSVLGDVVLEVMTGRDADAAYEINSHLHRTQMRFGDYVDRVLAESPTNDLYLVANNQFFSTDEAAELIHDVVIDGRYLDPDGWRSGTFLWFGPAGTVTPLHHDALNVLLVQVSGRKRVRLISPLYSHRLYNTIGVYSDVDPAHPDTAGAHPRFAGVPQLEVVLQPGEALFIPVGWWHHVESLDVAISVSQTNFRFPNGFDWPDTTV
jgi:Cupin-like domain